MITEEQGETIVLRPVREHDPVKSKNGVLVFSPTHGEKIDHAVEDHRKERLTRAAAWSRT